MFDNAFENNELLDVNLDAFRTIVANITDLLFDNIFSTSMVRQV